MKVLSEMVRSATESMVYFCMLCKCDFRTYVDNFKRIVHSSTVNLFTPSQRKEYFGVLNSRRFELCNEVLVYR